MSTPTPPAAQPQDRDRLLVQVLLVAAVVSQSGAAAGRTPHPLEYPPPVSSELREVVASLGNIEYEYRTGGREIGLVPAKDSRSPFFSLLSLSYIKPRISSCFHYQSAATNI